MDAVNAKGVTPLHYSASKGHDVLVALLLAAGADAAIPDENGDDATAVALRNGHESCARLIAVADAANLGGYAAVFGALDAVNDGRISHGAGARPSFASFDSIAAVVEPLGLLVAMEADISVNVAAVHAAADDVVAAEVAVTTCLEDGTVDGDRLDAMVEARHASRAHLVAATVELKAEVDRLGLVEQFVAFDHKIPADTTASSPGGTIPSLTTLHVQLVQAVEDFTEWKMGLVERLEEARGVTEASVDRYEAASETMAGCIRGCARSDRDTALVDWQSLGQAVVTAANRELACLMAPNPSAVDELVETSLRLCGDARLAAAGVVRDVEVLLADHAPLVDAWEDGGLANEDGSVEALATLVAAKAKQTKRLRKARLVLKAAQAAAELGSDDSYASSDDDDGQAAERRLAVAQTKVDTRRAKLAELARDIEVCAGTVCVCVCVCVCVLSSHTPHPPLSGRGGSSDRPGSRLLSGGGAKVSPDCRRPGVSWCAG